MAEVTAADLAGLGRQIIGMTDEQRAAYMTGLEAADLDVIEQAVTAAELQGADWRSTPATMAHHLSRGDFRLWRYTQLMGEFIAEAFKPDCPDPHRQIWVPSQLGKTMLGANWTPIWALDRNPRLRIMYLSFDADKAVEEAGNARDLAVEYSHELNFTIRPDRKARGRWTTPQGGGIYAVGIYGGIAGWPADVLIIDDLFRGWQSAHSPTARQVVWNILVSQVRKRLQGRHCPMLHLTTRWHDDDPAARWLRLAKSDPNADQWKVLRLAARAEPADPKGEFEAYRQPDPLGRQPGEVIEPLRFDEREVAARAAGSTYLANALEQQRPTSEEGGDIKRAWFKIRDTLPPRFDLEISSWDVKLKDKEAGDYVVGQHWGRAGGYWLTEELRGQWSQVATENAIALMAVRHPRIRAHYVENTGNGPEVLEALRRAHPGYVVSDEIAAQLGMLDAEREQVAAIRRAGMPRLIPVNVKGSKSVRMRAVSGSIEAGDVYLYEAPWNDGYLDELAAFGPNAAHDDRADSTSQALAKLLQGRASVKAATGTIPKAPISTRGASSSGSSIMAGQSSSRRGASRVIIPKVSSTGR